MVAIVPNGPLTGPVIRNEDKTVDFQFLDEKRNGRAGERMNGGDAVKFRFVNPADRTVQGSLSISNETGIAKMSLIDTDSGERSVREFQQKPDGKWKENEGKSKDIGNLHLEVAVTDRGEVRVEVGNQKGGPLFNGFSFWPADVTKESPLPNGEDGRRLKTLIFFDKDPNQQPYADSVAKINLSRDFNKGGMIVGGHMSIQGFDGVQELDPWIKQELVSWTNR